MVLSFFHSEQIKKTSSFCCRCQKHGFQIWKAISLGSPKPCSIVYVSPYTSFDLLWHSALFFAPSPMAMPLTCLLTFRCMHVDLCCCCQAFFMPCFDNWRSSSCTSMPMAHWLAHSCIVPPKRACLSFSFSSVPCTVPRKTHTLSLTRGSSLSHNPSTPRPVTTNVIGPRNFPSGS
jgi:hypothetical protein